MDAVMVSESGGTRLAVEDGRWVILSARGTQDADEAVVSLLPLLEREPGDALRVVRALQGPPFPWQQLIELALSGESAYWQERAVPWLDALQMEPAGELAEAAQRAIEMRRCGQRHRQQLHRWLRGKPIRGL